MAIIEVGFMFLNGHFLASSSITCIGNYPNLKNSTTTPKTHLEASLNLEQGAWLMNRIQISKLIAAIATLLIAMGVQLPAYSTGFPATLSVNSWPSGITVTSPNCFTVTSGTCGVTGWVSTNIEGIPTSTYTFPLTATIEGNDYQLSINSITGCNGNNGTSLPGQCTVQVAAGSLASIFATYKVLPSPPIPPNDV